MQPIFYDTETCGFHGPTVLIQWAEGDGPINLHSVWSNPISQTLELIERMMSHPGGLVGFNLSFDHFHLCQTYTTLKMFPDPEVYPDENIELYAQFEPEARLGPCLKPVTALDLMLYARKGPYQSMMNRGDIRIRRVPTALAFQLAAELERKVKISDIYFARRKNKYAPKWHVYDITDSDGDIDPDFKDIVLAFHPSSALKVLATDVLKLPPDDVLLFADIEISDKFQPEELGYAPFAMAVGSSGDWRGAWPDVIRHHIRHWDYDSLARKYAEKDVEYTRGLYNAFGKPALGDDDSELACMVGAVRWRGFAIDIPGIKQLRRDAVIRKGKYPTAPGPARAYICEVLSPEEAMAMKGSTKKILLEELAKRDSRPCGVCDGLGFIEDERPLEWNDIFDAGDIDNKIECPECHGKKNEPHPGAIRAAEVLAARKAGKEIELYDKLLVAGRLHADFVVIGTLSSRMAGAGGLNAQGIKRDKFVREKFPLAGPGTVLCGGDFDSFEVVLAIAEYKDEKLMAAVQQKRACHKCLEGIPLEACECAGTGLVGNGWCKHCLKLSERAKPDCDECKGTLRTDTKIHALFGMKVYPGYTYAQLLADKDKYTRSKSAVFAIMYGGEGYTLMTRLGVDIDVANKAHATFNTDFPGAGRSRNRIVSMFSALSQPESGKQVFWKDPADFIESMFGFRRHFTLENQIISVLYNLAQKPPAHWKEINSKVRRNKGRMNDREQTAYGATQSALFGAAFSLQGSNIRAANNHVIQSSGAQITKRVQRRIWDIQPSGANDWVVQPMNIHDEIMCVTDPGYTDRVRDAVNSTVESFRDKVPLIKMEWVTGMGSWAEK